MCYIIAKNRDNQGCFALKTKHGKGLVSLEKKITKKDGLQVVTISRPTAYGEYAPYTIANSENEFLELVKTL